MWGIKLNVLSARRDESFTIEFLGPLYSYILWEYCSHITYQTFVIFAKWNGTCFRVRFVFIMQCSTECSILHFSVSWHSLCPHGLRSYTYVSLSTYVCTFQCDLTCIDIFRIISRSRHINLMQFMYGYYLVVFLLLRHISILYYLYLVVLLTTTLATYASAYFICLVVLLARGRTKYVRYYLRLDHFVHLVLLIHVLSVRLKHRVRRKYIIRRKYPLILSSLTAELFFQAHKGEI